MIPHWPGLVDASELKGWEDGICCAPFSPILTEGMCPDADDAYNTAYWAGLAYAFRPDIIAETEAAQRSRGEGI